MSEFDLEPYKYAVVPDARMSLLEGFRDGENIQISIPSTDPGRPLSSLDIQVVGLTPGQGTVTGHPVCLHVTPVELPYVKVCGIDLKPDHSLLISLDRSGSVKDIHRMWRDGRPYSVAAMSSQDNCLRAEKSADELFAMIKNTAAAMGILNTNPRPSSNRSIEA